MHPWILIARQEAISVSDNIRRPICLPDEERNLQPDPDGLGF